MNETTICKTCNNELKIERLEIVMDVALMYTCKKCNISDIYLITKQPVDFIQLNFDVEK